MPSSDKVNGSVKAQLPVEIRKKVEQSLKAHLPEKLPSSYYPYGTAGFRDKASELVHVMNRCGILSVINAVASCKEFEVALNAQGVETQYRFPLVGCMVTASHNSVEDNGVKLVDFTGSLLQPEWEAHASYLVNGCPSDKGALNEEQEIKNVLWRIADISEKLGIEWSNIPLNEVQVVIGRDTRPSSEILVAALCSAIQSLGAKAIDLGIMTTPQLHYIIESGNFRNVPLGQNTLDYYYRHFGNQLKKFVELTTMSRLGDLHTNGNPVMSEGKTLHFDGANGVGGIKVAGFTEQLLKYLGITLLVKNNGSPGILNEKCGAEFVQKERNCPENFDSLKTERLPRCCSVDGDADRIVYFTWSNLGDEYSPMRLIDGDRIAVLLTEALLHLLRNCFPAEHQQMAHNGSTPPPKVLQCGVVQTAYANGGSTLQLSIMSKRINNILAGKFNLEVACVKTGVKYLHAKVLEYDIGIYFEANGHGTLHCHQQRLLSWARACGIEKLQAFECLQSFISLFHTTTGDALADMIAVESSLWMLNWSLFDWLSLYDDLPCIQSKVAVSRGKLDCLVPHPIHEKILLKPAEIQKSIDDAIAEIIGTSCDTKLVRAFIRPSGTEDVCRVYVEAPFERICKSLSSRIVTLIQQYNAA